MADQTNTNDNGTTKDNLKQSNLPKQATAVKELLVYQKDNNTTKDNIKDNKLTESINNISDSIDGLKENSDDLLEFIKQLTLANQKLLENSGDQFITQENAEDRQDKQLENSDIMATSLQTIVKFLTEDGGLKNMLVETMKGLKGELAIDTGGTALLGPGAGPGGFFISLGKGLKYWGDNFGSILKGAAAFSLSLLMVGGVIVILTSLIANFGQAASIQQMITFGTVLLLMGGFMVAYSKLMSGVNQTGLLIGSISMALVAASAVGMSYALQIISNTNLNIGNILILGASIGVLTGVAALVGMIGPLVIIGAAAMLMVSGSLLLTSIALKNISESKINYNTIAIVSASMLSLIGVTVLAGTLSPLLILGSIALMTMSMSLLPMSIALSTLNNLKLNSANIKNIIDSLYTLGTGIAGLGLLIVPMMAGSVAISLMGAGLLLVAAPLSILNSINISPDKINNIILSLKDLAGGISSLGIMSPMIIAGSISLSLMSIALLPMLPILGILNSINISPDKTKIFGNIIKNLAYDISVLGALAPTLALGSISMAIMGASLLPLIPAIGLINNLNNNPASVQLFVNSIKLLSGFISSMGIQSPLLILGSTALMMMSASIFSISGSMNKLSTTSLTKEKILKIGESFRQISFLSKDIKALMSLTPLVLSANVSMIFLEGFFNKFNKSLTTLNKTPFNVIDLSINKIKQLTQVAGNTKVISQGLDDITKAFVNLTTKGTSGNYSGFNQLVDNFKHLNESVSNISGLESAASGIEKLMTLSGQFDSTKAQGLKDLFDAISSSSKGFNVDKLKQLGELDLLGSKDTLLDISRNTQMTVEVLTALLSKQLGGAGGVSINPNGQIVQGNTVVAEPIQLPDSKKYLRK